MMFRDSDYDTNYGSYGTEVIPKIIRALRKLILCEPRGFCNTHIDFRNWLTKTCRKLNNQAAVGVGMISFSPQ